jgi:anti-sigma factor RsiW
MSCDEHQSMISNLLDGELPPGASSAVFAHLASCGACQLFYHRLQTLNASLDRIAARERESAAGGARPEKLWKRRIAVRVPVLVILLCVVAAGILFSVYGRTGLRSPETIYVTRIPAVVITSEAITGHQLQ